MKKILLVLFGLVLASSAYAFIPSYESPGSGAGTTGRNSVKISESENGNLGKANTMAISKESVGGLAAETTDKAKDMLKDAGESGHGGAWTGGASK